MIKALDVDTVRTRHSAWGLLFALEWLLLIAALLSMGYYALASTEAMLYQASEDRALTALLSTQRHNRRQTVGLSSPRSSIGRLEIPRLGVSTMVREGIDPTTLRLAIGHIPGTASPGEPGNVGLAGHRDTFFRRLQNLRVGDDIRLTTVGGSYVYRVLSTSIVWPNDTSVLEETIHQSLTLVTCYPFYFVGSAPKRFIVRAERTDAARTSGG